MTTATFLSAQTSLNIAASTPTIIGGYTVPAATTAIITAGAVTNKSGSNATLSVTIYNGSSDIAYIANGINLPVNGTFVFSGADAKWTLGAGQSIRVNCSQICDAILGVMQVA